MLSWLKPIWTCRTRLLCDFPYVACQHNMCSSFSKMQFLELHFIFLELVLSSSPQNQFSKVANTTSIKTYVFASSAISFPITEKLCCRFFKTMPSKPSNSNIQLHDEKWVWFYVPYSWIKLLLTQLFDFSTISYYTTGVSICAFYNYSYLKLHMISAPSVLYPLKPSQLFSSKTFNPPLLLPSQQLWRVIIW